MSQIIIKLNGHNNYSTIVDEDDYRTFHLSDYKWYPNISKSGTVYARAKKNGKRVSLHRLILGLEDGPTSVFVDHKDHNGLNNSRTNIRMTDNKGNQANSLKQLLIKTSSSYKGVSLDRNNKTNRWRARIMLSGEQKNLGHYRTEIEAATAYNKAAIELFGPMACLNVIGPKDFCLTDLTFPKSAPII